MNPHSLRGDFKQSLLHSPPVARVKNLTRNEIDVVRLSELCEQGAVRANINFFFADFY